MRIIEGKNNMDGDVQLAERDTELSDVTIGRALGNHVKGQGGRERTPHDLTIERVSA